MKILTLEQNVFDIDDVNEEIDDIRYAVFDNSDPKNPDYHYVPLIFVESFTAPALVLEIGGYRVKMPIDWKILIGDAEAGDLEAVPLTAISDRGFSAYIFNPIVSFKPEFAKVDVCDVYHDVSWYTPKLKNGHYLAVPLDSGPNPPCAYFIKEVSRSSEIVDYNRAW
jgi:hypothetical protein